MADRITLDFESGTIIWDTPAQKGEEFCPDLSERRAAVLEALGYEQVDFQPISDAVNAFANGQTSEQGFLQMLAALDNEN